jgi:hypothetical protein
MASQKTLIGRAVERATLGRLLNAVRGADSRVLVLRGEPGVGKTALLDDAIGSASDLRVLRAVGVESEMELAFAALHQLCAPVLDRLGRLPGPQQAALRVAFGLSGGEAPDRFLVGLAALSLLSEVAEEPAGQGRLGVAVDRQGAAAGAGEPRRQVDRGDRLADSAVMVGDGEDDRHGAPSPTDRADRRSRPAGAAGPVKPLAPGCCDAAWSRRRESRPCVVGTHAERQHDLGEAPEQRQEAHPEQDQVGPLARPDTRSDPTPNSRRWSMPIGGNGGITLIEQLCEVSRSNSWPLRRALTSTGRGYRQDGWMVSAYDGCFRQNRHNEQRPLPIGRRGLGEQIAFDWKSASQLTSLAGTRPQEGP